MSSTEPTPTPAPEPEQPAPEQPEDDNGEGTDGPSSHDTAGTFPADELEDSGGTSAPSGQ